MRGQYTRSWRRLQDFIFIFCNFFRKYHFFGGGWMRAAIWVVRTCRGPPRKAGFPSNDCGAGHHHGLHRGLIIVSSPRRLGLARPQGAGNGVAAKAATGAGISPPSLPCGDGAGWSPALPHYPPGEPRRMAGVVLHQCYPSYARAWANPHGMNALQESRPAAARKTAHPAPIRRHGRSGLITSTQRAGAWCRFAPIAGVESNGGGI